MQTMIRQDYKLYIVDSPPAFTESVRSIKRGDGGVVPLKGR
jgi:hypothetical protein